MFYSFWKKNILKKFTHLRDKILVLKKKTALLTDKQLQKKFNFYREKIQSSKKKDRGKLLDKYLVPVFSIVRETIYRKKGILLFPTQVFGGIVLHYGNVAQMNTGEGKTLTGLLPICLNALSGEPVYVSTVNEYLVGVGANLAQEIFGDVFKIGINSTNLSSEEKRDLYNNCDIIYTTASELGFDYLRSNLVTRAKDKINMVFSYLLLDEADLHCFDEAQNPLIISQSSRQGGVIHLSEYESVTQLANSLIEKKDYIVDQKEKDLWLTKKGIKKSQEFFQIDNLFSFQNHRYNFLLHNALKAKHFYLKDIEYIVDQEEQRIVLIDALTGRLVPNRVYSAGIQQAIESKEGLPVSNKSKTIATITYQNFFRLFTKLAGMTGTALTESEEFRQVYGMEVIAVPPYRKLIRKDRSDLIFWDKKSKYKAIIELIKKNNQTVRRPILIGSPNVEISEHLSSLLTKEKIFHYKLNAVNHKQEAEIIAQAGQLGAITISTNMAGRGTDIILSQESKKVGGLLVIGVERNTSRRIDNQLRGRSGRQGDQGESQFYVSLEDELIKNFAVKEKIGNFFSSQQLKALFHRPLSGKIFNYLVSEPQETLRNIHSAIRQNALNYDLLINRQRQVTYDYRDKLLKSPDPTKLIRKRLPKKTAEITPQDQEYLKILLVKEIDSFWSDYLEALNKIRALSRIKNYLPQDPQEGFFWETIDLFQTGFQRLNKRLSEIAHQ